MATAEWRIGGAKLVHSTKPRQCHCDCRGRDFSVRTRLSYCSMGVDGASSNASASASKFGAGSAWLVPSDDPQPTMANEKQTVKIARLFQMTDIFQFSFLDRGINRPHEPVAEALKKPLANTEMLPQQPFSPAF
ncbi:hypothetical protein [Novipirellula maiorica]|uniref:hypothetical protein n=1 Tax=Novipirellula maiorica TaxID=1265734 RepID=UPI0011818A71|nr:hypothetical protein [Rhodopirellula maiorica]